MTSESIMECRIALIWILYKGPLAEHAHGDVPPCACSAKISSKFRQLLGLDKIAHGVCPWQSGLWHLSSSYKHLNLYDYDKEIFCSSWANRSICHQSFFHVPANSGKLRWVVLACQCHHWLFQMIAQWQCRDYAFY